MNKELTCQQVSALMNFYIEGKLNPRLREYVNSHIAKCKICKKKIDDLQKFWENMTKKNQKLVKLQKTYPLNLFTNFLHT